MYGMEEEKGKKDTKTEGLRFSLWISSLPRVYCSTSPNHCGLEDNQVKAFSEQSRANTVLSMACRKSTTEDRSHNLAPLPSACCRSFRRCAHVSSSKSSKNRLQGPRSLLTPRPRPRTSQRGLTCDAEIRDTSCRPVRSDEETLAGAPRCNLMLTFRSLSTLEIALGDVFPVGAEKRKTTTSA